MKFKLKILTIKTLQLITCLILMIFCDSCKKTSSKPEKFSSLGIPWDELVLPDGGMLIGINTGIVRINADCEKKWVIELNNNQPKFIPSFIAILPDGNYICLGSSNETDNNSGRPIYYLTMIKIDPDGKEIWRREVSDRLEYFMPKSMEVIDGGVICISAVSNFFSTVFYHFMKFDSEGKLLRLKDLNENKFLVASKNTNLYTNNYSNYLIRMDSAFQEQDQISIQGANNVILVSDGFIVNSVSADSCIELNKYNMQGILEWKKTYNELKFHRFGSLVEESDGSFAICGTMFYFESNSEMFFSRISKDGNIYNINRYKFDDITIGFKVFKRSSNRGYFISTVTADYVSYEEWNNDWFSSLFSYLNILDYNTKIIRIDNEGRYIE